MNGLHTPRLAAAQTPILPSDLDVISLDELNARAAMMTRVDRKYVVEAERVPEILAQLHEDTRALEIGGKRAQNYASCYFDTPDYDSYMGAAHKRRRRFKVRTRTYVDSQLAFLEVKTRGARGNTVKKRISYAVELAELGHLSRGGRTWVSDILTGAHCSDESSRLSPVLRGSYTRSTLLMPEGGRATIDSDLAWESQGYVLTHPGMVIIETKSSASPSQLDRALWAASVRPAKISKYATAMAAFNPELPRNKWTRVLDCFFEDAQLRVGGGETVALASDVA